MDSDKKSKTTVTTRSRQRLESGEATVSNFVPQPSSVGDEAEASENQLNVFDIDPDNLLLYDPVIPRTYTLPSPEHSHRSRHSRGSSRASSIRSEMYAHLSAEDIVKIINAKAIVRLQLKDKELRDKDKDRQKEIQLKRLDIELENQWRQQEHDFQLQLKSIEMREAVRLNDKQF